VGPKRFVLTGAPGTGKTAIVERLRGEFMCLDEPARAVIAEQRASGGRGTWDQDPALFVELLLRASISRYRTTLAATILGSPAAFVFDRAIPDCVVYADRAGVDPGPCLDAVGRFPYDEVLFCEAWGEIYATDEERMMSFEEAEMFGAELRTVYEDLGHTPVPVPRGPIEARVAFVRSYVYHEVDQPR
jgi:predicted ATPase